MTTSRFERADRWIALLIGLPAGLMALGTQWMVVRAVADEPLGALEWVGVLWSPAWAFVGTSLFGVALFLLTAGTKWRAVARGLAVLLLLTALGLDLLARAPSVVTGTAYSFHALAYFWREWESVQRVALSILDPSGLAFQLIALAGVVAGVTAALTHRQPASAPPPSLRPATASLGLGLVAFVVAAFPPAPPQVPVSTAVVPFLWIARSALHAEGPVTEPAYREGPALQPPEERPPNLVVITLESVGQYVTSFGAAGFDTTPKLAALAQSSRRFERTYVPYPHSTKAMVPMFCGVEPWASMHPVDSWPGGLRADCLPKTLAGQGYDTVFFRSAMGNFEGWPELARGLGFAEFYAEEDLPTDGFERANYFGYEDDIMLEPSREWIRAHGDAPFLMLYNTGTPHHDYQVPSRYPLQDFVADPEHNAYLNAVVYVDHFVDKVLRLFEEEGLYEDTVFIIIGDHGEGFGLHRERFHDLSMYEEVVRVPFLLHHGLRYSGVESEPVSQLDLPGTALQALGFTQEAPVWTSALSPSREQHFAVGWHVARAAMLVEDRHKLIHRFDDLPDELYDVVADPEEMHDLAAEHPERVDALRADLEAWYATRSAWGRWMVAHVSEPDKPEEPAR